MRGLEVIATFEVAYTDFTELPYAEGKAYLVVLLDHVTKLVLGWAVLSLLWPLELGGRPSERWQVWDGLRRA